MIYEPLVERLAEACSCDVDDLFAPAEEDDLVSLDQLGMPESVMEFYRERAPIDVIEVGDTRLFPIAQLLEENQSYSPGAEVHEHNYIVIAGNREGDAFCLDLGPAREEDPPSVVRLAHDFRAVSHSRVEVEEAAKPISDTFEDFLDALAGGRISA